MPGGRPRTPTALHVLRGNPGKRKPPKNEPKPREIPPEMPNWLDNYGQEAWKELSPVLERMRVLTEADGAALAQCCLARSIQRHLIDSLPADGDYLTEYTNKAGATNESIIPQVKAISEYSKLVRMWLTEFGATPSARSRVQTNDNEPKDDEFSAFMNRGKG